MVKLTDGSACVPQVPGYLKTNIIVHLVKMGCHNDPKTSETQIEQYGLKMNNDADGMASA